jgi:hypothetical protein
VQVALPQHLLIDRVDAEDHVADRQHDEVAQRHVAEARLVRLDDGGELGR